MGPSRRRLMLNKIIRIDPNMMGPGTLSEEEEIPEILLSLSKQRRGHARTQ